MASSFNLMTPNQSKPADGDIVSVPKGDWFIWQKPGDTGKAKVNFNNRGWSLFPPESSIAVYNTSVEFETGVNNTNICVFSLQGIERFSLY